MCECDRTVSACRTVHTAQPALSSTQHGAAHGTEQRPHTTTSYALLRTTQAHRDTPTAANHPRPRRPTDRLCNGQCTSNSQVQVTKYLYLYERVDYLTAVRSVPVLLPGRTLYSVLNHSGQRSSPPPAL